MKKDFLWFDEQLWSSLCAGPKKRWHTGGSGHPIIQGEFRPKLGDGVKVFRGRAGIQLILIALIVATAFLGCNTMRGVGKDVEGGGKSIQRAVNHND